MAKRLDTTSFYRRIMSDAWSIAWQHKQLWIFGFFATLLGFGGVLEVFFGTVQSTSGALSSAAAYGNLESFVPGIATVRTLIQFSPDPSLALAIFALLALLLLAVFAWMTVVSVGALVSDTRKISRGGEPTFADGVKAGVESFWPLLVVIVAAKVVDTLALTVTSVNLGALLSNGSYTSAAMYVGSYISLAVVTFIAGLVAVFAAIAIIAKREHPSAALVSAFRLVSKHWLVMLEMSILLVVASVAIGILGAFPIVLMAVPLIFLIAVASTMEIMAAVSGLYAFTAAMLIVGAILVGSLVTVFSTAAWTLLWGELADRTPGAFLHRAVHRLRSRGKKR